MSIRNIFLFFAYVIITLASTGCDTVSQEDKNLGIQEEEENEVGIVTVLHSLADTVWYMNEPVVALNMNAFFGHSIGQVLSYSANTNSEHISIDLDGSILRLGAAEPGSGTIQVVAMDGLGESDSLSFQFTAANPCPEQSPDLDFFNFKLNEPQHFDFIWFRKQGNAPGDSRSIGTLTWTARSAICKRGVLVLNVNQQIEGLSQVWMHTSPEQEALGWQDGSTFTGTRNLQFSLGDSLDLDVYTPTRVLWNPASETGETLRVIQTNASYAYFSTLDLTFKRGKGLIALSEDGHTNRDTFSHQISRK